MKLPFGWLPGHWGLAGKTRAVAQAEYELEGYELEKTLLELRKDEMPFDDYFLRFEDLALKHGKITREQYKRDLLTLIKDEKQRSLAELELNYTEGKIGELEFNKNTATIKEEPWVTVIEMDFGGKNALEGSFELDWNEFFVDKLRAEGYVAPTPDAIVNQWFMEVCRNVAMEEFDGTGDFTADSEANLAAMKRWGSEKTDTYQNGRKGYK